jgi:hypothetical protein
MAMTEPEWMKSSRPGKMLIFLRRKASARKLRLFAVACCRLSCTHLTDEWSRRTVEVAEREADGLNSPDARGLAERDARVAIGLVTPREKVALAGAIGALFADASQAAKTACSWAGQFRLFLGYEQRPFPAKKTKVLAEWDREAVALLRCIFGNPFRPVTIESSWLTPTVLSLGESIYVERAFDHLPILADALEDAGCSNQDILDHCRQAGDHVRGCWVLDHLLGKM